MILNELKIFSQNVCKNSFIINLILEVQISYDVIFIQEPSWSFIHSILSSKNSKEEELVRVSNYPNWITFSRNSIISNNLPRVITYINIRLTSLCFSLCKDVFNYRNISCIFFFNYSLVYFLINIYSDSSQIALKYLKDTEININNVIIMTGDFDIRDCSWNHNFLHHSIDKDTLIDIANYFQLELSEPINKVPTRYSDNQCESNSVINLMFFRLYSLEYNNHSIYLDLHLTSDHILLMVNISITFKPKSIL